MSAVCREYLSDGESMRHHVRLCVIRQHHHRCVFRMAAPTQHQIVFFTHGKSPLSVLEVFAQEITKTVRVHLQCSQANLGVAWPLHPPQPPRRSTNVVTDWLHGRAVGLFAAKRHRRQHGGHRYNVHHHWGLFLGLMLHVHGSIYFFFNVAMACWFITGELCEETVSIEVSQNL